MVIEPLERLAASCLFECAAICRITLILPHTIHEYIVIAVTLPVALIGEFGGKRICFCAADLICGIPTSYLWNIFF